jgi:molybdopterin synthase catalytic subunit
MSTPRLAIVREPLSIEQLAADVEAIARSRGEGCGAVASFLGVVRATHKGRAVKHLEYEAFDALAAKVFEQIDAEVLRQWPEAVLGLRHRVGRLAVGDASVAIAVATPHRAESFQAARYAIERVKQIAPIWKHEFFEDGEAWVEGAIADPNDAAAREFALRTCRADAGGGTRCAVAEGEGECV